MTYLCKTEGKNDQRILWQALEGVREALLDDDTTLGKFAQDPHRALRLIPLSLVSRPGLIRRLRRLEKMLKVPDEECAVCEGELRFPSSVTVMAKRIYHSEHSLKLDATGKAIKNKENITLYLNPNATGAGGSSLTGIGESLPVSHPF